MIMTLKDLNYLGNNHDRHGYHKFGEEFGINFSLVTHYELKLTYKG